MTLQDLIASLERLGGSSRQLDGQIFMAVTTGGTWQEFGDVWHLRDEADHVAFEGPPQYTASIDAALTLVPDGQGYKIHRDNVEHEIQYDAQVDYGEFHPGASEAIALCIAALKARQP